MHDTDALITRLPKCELHIHVEGSLEPELMFALARRNGIRLPYASVDAVRQAYRFGNLQDFLDLYYRGMSVLITEQDFYDLAFAYLAREQVPLTVCPQANVRLRVVDDLAHHPLRRMLDKGLMVTVNSDDPAYFGGYVNENYRASAQALGLGRDEIAAIVRNGIKASLMTTAEKDQALADVDRVLAESA